MVIVIASLKVAIICNCMQLIVFKIAIPGLIRTSPDLACKESEIADEFRKVFFEGKHLPLKSLTKIILNMWEEKTHSIRITMNKMMTFLKMK